MGVLSKELFKQGEPYGQAAMDLVEAAGAGRLPPIPQVAKNRGLLLVEAVADPKVVRKYGDSLAEAFGCSYRFATAETWEDLDREQARSLIDEGLARVHQQHLDTGVLDPLDAADPEHRAHYSMVGLTGTHPAFEQVRQYIFTRSAYERLETLDDLHLRIGLAAGGVKGRHTDQFMQAQVVAWRAGRALGADEDELARAVWIVRGVSGDQDRFQPLTEFFRSQPVYERLAAFADTFLVRPDEKLAEFLHADESRREKVETAASLGWNAGVTLALLEKIGGAPAARED